MKKIIFLFFVVSLLLSAVSCNEINNIFGIKKEEPNQLGGSGNIPIA